MVSDKAELSVSFDGSDVYAVSVMKSQVSNAVIERGHAVALP